MREIEIKLRVNDLDEVEERLKQQGCVLSEPISQHDTIYSLPSKSIRGDFGDTKEGHIAVRLRKQSDDTIFNLKKQLTNEMDNIEYETKVEDGETMHQILQLLEWKPEVEVKKTRKKGKLGEYEICLDRVEELGNFIEIEKMTDDNADPEQARKELFEALKPFGLTEKDEETKGYDTQIYQLQNKK